MMSLVIYLCLTADDGECVEYRPYDPMPRSECKIEARRVMDMLVAKGQSDSHVDCEPLPEIAPASLEF